jgi:phosphatidylglycerophosphate synthase
MPLYIARTTTSSGDGDASRSGRISPWPGEATQKARASVFTAVNSGAFREHVTIPKVELRTRVAFAAIAACVATAIAATMIRRALPLGALYALKSTATLAAVMITAAALVRAYHPFARFGAANRMTLLRAGLVALIAGLIGEPAVPTVAAAAVGVAAIVEVFDGVDGWLARRDGLASAFGARFDMEIDALLIIVLAILAWQHGKAGGWVLLSGLLRYAFVVAGWLAPWVASPLPSSRRRQAICVIQIVTLAVIVSPLLPANVTSPLAAAALVALTASFLVDVVWLWRARSSSTATTTRVRAFPSSS